jgi:hypothetical protein
MSTLVERAIRTSRAASAVSRVMGFPWLMRRVSYAASLRLGFPRWRLPASRWEDVPLDVLLSDSKLSEPVALVAHRAAMRGRFFVPIDGPDGHRTTLRELDNATEAVISAADRIVDGVWTWFSGVEVSVGPYPRWNRDPFTGRTIEAAAHWSTIDDFEGGDIKVVWEPSRFGMVYPLVRAYWRTGDERYADCFWSLVESWRLANPPQQGPNWKCGQEAAFRVMAWTFGLHGFFGSPATTPDRVGMLVQMIGVSGRRIAANVGYALLQQNNHGVSEGTGLLTLGLLFPEFKEASRWRAVGREILERLVRELVYDDGAFSQHSLNYQRLMLHDYAWSVRLAQLAGEPLSEPLRERIARSADLLWQMLDASTGTVPTYGANDGSLILPLTNCAYDDFRPVVQTLSLVTGGQRRLSPGPWDEEAFWLCGPEALRAPCEPEKRHTVTAPIGGYFVQRDAESYLVVRAVDRFRHRPGHADLLHVDLTWRGVNVALDAGTCSYNDQMMPDAAFDRTRFHNTIVVDGLDQMERASRFLWAPWPRGGWTPPGTPVKVPGASSEDCIVPHWEGWHDGYTRLADPVIHRRAVAGLGGGVWVVADQLDADGPHDARLHWLLPDLPFTFTADAVLLDTPAGAYAISVWSDNGQSHANLVHAGDDLVGWRSRRYGSRESALALILTRRATRRPRFITVFAPEPVEIRSHTDGASFGRVGEIVRLEFAATPGQPWLRIVRSQYPRCSQTVNATARL